MMIFGQDDEFYKTVDSVLREFLKIDEYDSNNCFPGFNAAIEAEKLIHYIRHTVTETGGKGAVIGISGGKDSAVVAALAVKALGADNVIGCIMPKHENNLQYNQSMYDDEDSYRAIAFCKKLKIKHVVEPITQNVTNILNGIYLTLKWNGIIGKNDNLDSSVSINIQPRLRMTILYAISQQLHYRVLGTSNLSENFVGYCTKWGDTACDINPINDYLTTEVVKIGKVLDVWDEILYQAPADGLTGRTDEEVLGISYDEINKNIINYYLNNKKLEAIDNLVVREMFENSRHKTGVDNYYHRFK